MRVRRNPGAIVAYAAASWSGFCALVHVYWALGGDIGLPSDLNMRAEPLLFAVDLAAIPLFGVLAWLCLRLAQSGGPMKTQLERVAVTGAALFCFVHALPPLAAASWRALVGGQSFASGERERLALLAYEPMWLVGGLLLVAALVATRRIERQV